MPLDFYKKFVLTHRMNNWLGEEDKNVELRLTTFGSEHLTKVVFVVVNACTSKDHTDNIVGVCFIGQDVTGQRVVMYKFIHIQGDYKAIVHSPNPLIHLYLLWMRTPVALSGTPLWKNSVGGIDVI